MSKEAEEFFRQKTIENATRPRMKKFLALVNREIEGKIMQEYADQQLKLHIDKQKLELSNFIEWYVKKPELIGCDFNIIVNLYINDFKP